MPRCKNCKDKFTPIYFNQKFCMEQDECIRAHVVHAKELESKQWKKEKAVRKRKLKTRSEWMNDMQRVFNTFIRERDKELPCISCGTLKAETYDAGHYRTVGAHPELRFDENNVHKQCRKCNGYWGGNIIEYRKNLILKIGIDEVNRLERNDLPPLKLTTEEIQEQIKIYNKKKINFK